jgi:hypothetical protein
VHQQAILPVVHLKPFSLPKLINIQLGSARLGSGTRLAGGQQACALACVWTRERGVRTSVSIRAIMKAHPLLAEFLTESAAIEGVCSTKNSDPLYSHPGPSTWGAPVGSKRRAASGLAKTAERPIFVKNRSTAVSAVGSDSSIAGRRLGFERVSKFDWDPRNP